MKNFIITSAGVIGSVIASIFGGWSEALTTLLIVMGIDYITGVVLALVFHKSPKTETGAYESKAGWKGLFRKAMILCIIVIAHRIDLIMVELGLMVSSSYVMDGVCIAFILNDILSIIENAGLMGVPVPKFLVNALNMLKQKNEGDQNV